MAQDIAESIIEGGVSLPSSGATHYHATSVQPYWADAYEKIGMVGDHVFYIWQ